MKIKRFVLGLLIVLLLTGTAGAVPKGYYADSLTGGADALDAIDGAGLADRDLAIVGTGALFYAYQLDADSAAAESSPDIISPTTNAGDKRWILLQIPGADSISGITSQAVGETDGQTLTTKTLNSPIINSPTIATPTINVSIAGTAFLDEDTLNSDSATKVASQQSIKAYIDTLQTLMKNNLTGMSVRSKFRWKSVTEIYIGAGNYDHEGTTHQSVYWDSELTYTVVTNGAPDWVYIYLDDSSIVTAGTNVISTSELIDSATVPTYSPTKKGLYNGNDRAIFAVYLVANDVVEFFHGSDTVLHADQIENQAAVDIDLVYTDIGALIIPDVATVGIISLITSGIKRTLWRTNGQAGTVGHAFGSYLDQVGTVVTDASQVIEVKLAGDDATTVQSLTHGWKFPIGM